MPSMKRRYVQSVHALAAVPPLARFADSAVAADAYGWRRWLASLLAIYNTQRMVALGLPWWNVAATRDVESHLARRPNARVFEYGAGASTVWLARRATQVTSVEHDPAFIEKFREMVGPLDNVTLLERGIEGGPDAYVDAIEEVGGLFDLIVVDGRHRAVCLAAAAKHLKPDGLVLFDDSGRKRYRAAIDGCGLVENHYFGRSFCVPYPDHTSILSRRG
jgi:SAM-dependent methyltransferase